MSFSPATRGVHAHINMTPMIDVLLVLLIIFMVVAPTHPTGLPAALLQPSASSIPENGEPNVILQVEANGSTWINSQPVSRDELGTTLRNIYSSRADRTLFLRGDGQLEFSSIAEVIDAARSAGVDRTALLTGRYDLR